MAKKMKLPFLSNSIQARSSWPWPWPFCQHPRTLSFRGEDETPTFSAHAAAGPGDDPVETVIQGLVRSERLFFEPGQTSSILEEAKSTSGHVLSFNECVVLSIESRDPLADFRKSMAEMVEAQGLRDWERLEELLCWYLKANGKSNHSYIVAAFVALLVELAINNSSTCNDCVSSSPLSFNTSSSSSSFSCSSSSSENTSSATTPCVSSLSDQKEFIEADH